MGPAEPKEDHPPGVGEVKRLQGAELGDPVAEIGPLRQGLPKLQLGKDDNLQQLMLIGLKIKELPEDLQTIAGQLLPLIDNKDGGFVLLDSCRKKMLLDSLLDFPLGTVAGAPSIPKASAMASRNSLDEANSGSRKRCTATCSPSLSNRRIKRRQRVVLPVPTSPSATLNPLRRRIDNSNRCRERMCCPEAKKNQDPARWKTVPFLDQAG